MSLNLNMYPEPPETPLSLSDVHAFAQGYLRIFSDLDMPEEALRHPTFALLCKKMGFECDQGEAFSEIWSQEAYENTDALSEIIYEVEDPILLGDTIFSKWVGLATDPLMSLNTPTNRNWFILALEQLCDLSAKYEPLVS